MIAIVIVLALAGCSGPEPTVEEKGIPLAAFGPAGTDEEGEGEEMPDPVPPDRPRDRPLYVVLGGDVMLQAQLHDIVDDTHRDDPAAGWAWYLHALGPLLDDLRSRGDVRFVVNLESPVATERYEPRSFPPRFNGPSEALEGLRLAGVDAVTLANNHALDQGRAGLVETVQAARKAGLGVAGGGEEPALARAPLALDADVVLLAYFGRPRGGGEPTKGATVAVLDERSIEEVRAAAGLWGTVIVTIHWVGEFVSTPRDEWVEWAHRLVDAGADAVVCHGPHVPGPLHVVETSSGRQAPVAYSLGNLLSNMGWEVYPGKTLEPGKDSAQRIEAREEALLVLEVAGAGEQTVTGYALVPLFLMDNRYAVHREDSGPRLIYPLPLPGCVLPDPVPCFPATKPAECDALATMLDDSCTHVMSFEREDPVPLVRVGEEAEL